MTKNEIRAQNPKTGQGENQRAKLLKIGKTYAEESRPSTHVRAHRLRVLDVDKKKAKNPENMLQLQVQY